MTTSTLAGMLLVAAASVEAAWSAWLFASGTPVAHADFETWPRLARRMRWTVSLWMLANLLSLSGFAVLSTLLVSDADRGVAVIALVLLALASVFVILEGTHHVTLGIWSAEEASVTGTRPAFSGPVARWASGAFQAVFYTLGMVSLALFGIAIVLTDVVSAWTGWFALAWGVAGLAASPLRNRLTWALVIPIQLVLGSVLLMQG